MAKIDRSKYRLRIDQYSISERGKPGTIGRVVFHESYQAWVVYAQDKPGHQRFLRDPQKTGLPATFPTDEDAAAALAAHHENRDDGFHPGDDNHNRAPGKQRHCKSCDGPFTMQHPATDVGSDLYHLERESCRDWRHLAEAFGATT